MQDGQAEIIVKLLSSGRYVWSIGVEGRADQTGEGIKLLKSINNKMIEEFPEYARRGSGRIANLDED